jgi:hypothetical protein
MIESDEIKDLENRLDWIMGRKPAVILKKVRRPLKISEYNVNALFDMSLKELLYILCRKLDYVVVKKKSSIDIIR